MSIVLCREDLEKVWEYLEPSLDPKFTVAKITHTQDEVWEYLARGQAFVCYGDKSAMLVEICLQNPEHPFLNAWATGGNLKELMTVVWPEVEEWGRRFGAKKIVGEGRRQWGAALSKIGFQVETIIYSKEL